MQRERTPVLVAGCLAEQAKQGLDVLGSIAQRRDPQADHVQAVEQVFAERPILDGLFEGHARRRDHPHVDGDFTQTAHRAHLALLEHAQGARLGLGRHVAHLVEEECAFVGVTKQAGPRPLGPRVGAVHVPEQLGFDQGFGDRPAIHGNEAASATRALVDRARDQLLARAGLAEQQHRRRGRGNLHCSLEQLLHLWTSRQDRDVLAPCATARCSAVFAVGTATPRPGRDWLDRTTFGEEHVRARSSPSVG